MGCKDRVVCSVCDSEGLIYKENHEACCKKFERKRILIICTGNSCRSQMAESWLKSFDERLDVFSAGTHPEKEVNPNALAVMKEIGIDISQNYPKSVNVFIKDTFDFVITVCDHASEVCPVFTGNVLKRLHLGFIDPLDTYGTDEEILEIYRNVRDQIRDAFYAFYTKME